jgi:cyclopropane fatty-acyl-phospholipid synthase-like methyltransferase
MTGSHMPDAGMNPLHNARYPRSNNYDPNWVFENQMGPNALWLMEALVEVLPIEPGMRVLDLGCGKAMTSVFLAKEFGAEIWATDLWIDASANQERICEAGVEKLVVPIHSEAHALPFAQGFFDVIVSVDAYQYFGTADLYLGYITGIPPRRWSDRSGRAGSLRGVRCASASSAPALLGVGFLLLPWSGLVEEPLE